MKINREQLSIVFGAISLILVTSMPFILDLIEPAKNIGQVIGENTKNLIDTLNGKEITPTNALRDTWYNILTIISFISVTISLTLSSQSLFKHPNKWYGITGTLLSLASIGIYFSSIFIGLFGLAAMIIIGLLVLGYLDYT